MPLMQPRNESSTSRISVWNVAGTPPLSVAALWYLYLRGTGFELPCDYSLVEMGRSVSQHSHKNDETQPSRNIDCLMPEYLIPHMLGLWIEKRVLRRMFGSKERKPQKLA
jgi:hypothetical protein